MVIYSNGCSHTKTSDHFFSHGYIDIISKELFGESYKQIELPRGLNNDEKNELINKDINSSNIVFKHSLSGKSNDLIFFETLNFIYTTLSTKIKPDLIIIQWSGPNRRFHVEYDGNIVDVNAHDNSELGVKFEPIATEQTIQYMVTLQDICKFNEIDFIFIPYMELDKDVAIDNPLVKRLELDRFSTLPTEGHRNYFRKNGLSMDIQGHPNFYGIYELSKIVLKILGKNIRPIDFYIQKDDIKNSNHPRSGFIKKYSSEIGDGVLEHIKKLKDII